jgi:GumC protein
MSKPIAERVVKALKMEGGGDRVSFIRDAISVERHADSRIFLIKARAHDPVLARDIANTTVRVYSELSVERVVEASRKSISWLTEQLIDLKKKVEDSEMSLIKYIEEENLTSTGDGSALQREASLHSSYSLGEDKALQDLNTELVKTELELDRMKSRFGNRYPSVAHLRSEIALIQVKVDSEKRKLIEGNKKKIRYNILSRDAELNKELYNLFMKELKETNVIAEMGMSNVTVINEAELPGAPISPRVKFDLIVGAILGLLLGFGAALSQELLDRTLKTEDDVRRHLELPLLAYIIFEGYR